MPVPDENKMVKPLDHSSENDEIVRKHNRSSSSDQAKLTTTTKVIEQDLPIISPNKSKSLERPQSKRRKSTSSTKTRTRPTYSRKYSTPPSRPLSPSGFPRILDDIHMIPELDLDHVSQHFTNQHLLQVDTAPQEPDLWSDPETDYFSTIEGPAGKHGRAKSRRQLSQNLNATNSLNAVMAGSSSGNGKGLRGIKEDVEVDFLLPPTPGAFAA